MNVCSPLFEAYGLTNEEFIKALPYKGDLTDENLLMNKATPDEVMTYLLNKGYEPFSENSKYFLNPYVYWKYKVVAYTDQAMLSKLDSQATNSNIVRVGLGSKGSPQITTEKEININYEYRYLGYKVDGINIITNDFYPADSKTVSNFIKRNYKPNDPNLDSWRGLKEKYPNLIEHILLDKVYNDDKESGVFEHKDYRISDAIHTTNIDTLMKYPKILQVPSFGEVGSYNLIHSSRGKIWYDTVQQPQFTIGVATTIEPKRSEIIVPLGTKTVDINYTVKTEITNLVTDTRSNTGRYIYSVDLTSNREENLFKNKALDNIPLSNLDKNLIKTVNVENYLLDHAEPITLNAKSTVKTHDGSLVSKKAEPKNVSIKVVAGDEVDFIIKHNETDVTDGTVVVESLENPSLSLTLNDISLVQTGDVIERTWTVLTKDGEKDVARGNELAPIFTIDASNRDCVIEDTVIFFETVYTLNGKVGQSCHCVKLEEKKPLGPSGGVVAVLTATADYDEDDDRYTVMEGQNFYLRGNKSYHENDLDIVDHDFDIGESQNEGVLVKTMKKRVKVFYPKANIYGAYLTVTDEIGASDTDSIDLTVIPARFDPIIEVTGTLKENRKFTVSVDNEHTLHHYPVDQSSLQWTLTPLDGQGNVIHIDGSLDGTFSFDAQAELKGRYKITVTGQIESIYNSNRYRGSAERIISIVEDVPPLADFRVKKVWVRDIKNNNIQRIYATSNSGSMDNDRIVQHIWSYKFDSDNDGDFDDETALVYSVANDEHPYFETDRVGWYQIELKVKEEFGQETISRFATDADRRRGDTASKPSEETKLEMKNVAPVVALEIAPKKKVHAIVYEDLTADEKLELETKIEELKIGLLEKKIDLVTHYLTPNEVVGEREYKATSFNTYVNLKIMLEGEERTTNGRNDLYETNDYPILLDSFCMPGTRPNKSNVGRFEIVSVTQKSTWDNYVYRDTDKAADYWMWHEFEQFKITYKDNGVVKVKNFNLAKKYDHKDDDSWGGTNYERHYDIDVMELNGYELVEDEVRVGGKSFYDTDYTPQRGDSWTNSSTVASLEDTTKELKIPNNTDLSTILKGTEGNDVFFLNLTSEENNRLALNKEFKKMLEDNNCHYMTLDEFSLAVNPLSGRVDEVFGYKDNSDDLYFAVGDDAYKIVGPDYIAIGNLEKAKENYGTSIFDVKKTPSLYSTAGMSALRHSGRYDDNYDIYDAWMYYIDDLDRENKSLNDFLHNYLNYSMYFLHPTVENDGTLINYKRGRHPQNAYLWQVPYIAGHGYTGIIQDFNFTLSGQEYNKCTPVRGYVKENGDIEFKYNIQDFYSSLKTAVVVTEGIGNIRNYVVNESDNILVVITDSSIVRYNLQNGTRTVLASGDAEIRGTSIKIGDNKWQVGDKIYDGYKEIYTTDLNGEYITVRGGRWNNEYAAKFTMKVYIDLEDKLYVEKDYELPGDPVWNYSTKDLIATDVKTLPLMKYENLPIPDTIDGEIKGQDAYKPYPDSYHFHMQFIKNDGKLYSIGRNSRYGDTSSFMIKDAKVESIYPVFKKVHPWSNPAYYDYYSLIKWEDDPLKIVVSNQSHGTNKKYATLTNSDSDNVVSDSELIGLSNFSSTHESLQTLINSILTIYKDYATSDKLTILLNDQVTMKMLMQDYENDPAYAMLINSEHVDPNYYENSLGRDTSVGEGIAMTTFTKVGHYKMTPRVRDNPVGTDNRFDNYRLWNKDNTFVDVFVHRRPVAKMKLYFKEAEDSMIAYLRDANSYDLDHESEDNHGIIAWKWSIKSQDDTLWQHYSGPSVNVGHIEKGKSYTIIYRVQDQEGVWSYPVREDLVIEGEGIGLSAKVKSGKVPYTVMQMPIRETYKLHDIETIYSGELRLEIGLYKEDKLLSPLKTIAFEEGLTASMLDPDQGLVAWSDQTIVVPDIVDTSYEIGVKAVSVTTPSKSEMLVLDVGVLTPIEPVAKVEELFMTGEKQDISCQSSIYTDRLSLTLYEGSPYESVLEMTKGEVIINESGIERQVWELEHQVPQDLKADRYKLVFEGHVDTRPSKKESVTAWVRVIDLSIDTVQLIGDWSHWRGQVDLLGQQLLDMPYRFLSWEQVHFTVVTKGKPDQVFIRMSPELEAMSFTDDNGTTFTYQEAFGKTVDFPLYCDQVEDDLWRCDYILPLAESTISWEDDRLRPSYEIIVTAKKGETERYFYFKEAEDRAIEITGNTTNLIYVQPLSQ